jgi:hypothetical protein
MGVKEVYDFLEENFDTLTFQILENEEEEDF